MDAEAVCATPDDRGYRATRECPDRGLESEEQGPVLMPGANLAKIAQECRSNTGREWQETCNSWFRAANTECLFLPVHVVELQPGDLAGPETVGNETP